MSAQSKDRQQPAAKPEVESVNQVRLVGRISQPPHERVLPSGDAVWTFRIVVSRPGGGTGERGRSRQSVDSLECAVWGGRVRRSVMAWSVDDVVEVSGSVRSRFYRAGGAVASRVEIEVTAGRLIRHAASG